jgi:hypothetical protein
VVLGAAMGSSCQGAAVSAFNDRCEFHGVVEIGEQLGLARFSIGRDLLSTGKGGRFSLVIGRGNITGPQFRPRLILPPRPAT